jgi:hypothetical protein
LCRLAIRNTLISTYDPTNEQTAGRSAYYGEDQSLYAERSPLRHIRARIVPIFIVFAEFDPPRFQLEAAALFKAICERDNCCPPMRQLLGHNHMTQVYHIGTSDDSIGENRGACVNCHASTMCQAGRRKTAVLA